MGNLSMLFKHLLKPKPRFGGIVIKGQGKGWLAAFTGTLVLIPSAFGIYKAPNMSAVVCFGSSYGPLFQRLAAAELITVARAQ